MRASRPAGGVVVAGALAVGFALSHWLTYLIIVPRASDRDELLRATGHGYWPFAVAVAAVLGLAALAETARGAVAQARDADRGWQPVRPLVARLAEMQLLAFLVLETLEHLSSGDPGLQFLLGAPFLVGLAVQVIVATALGLFLSGFARAAELIARIILPNRGPQRSLVAVTPARIEAQRARVVGLPRAGVRAPPVSQIRMQSN